jgi:hypothetical protein
MEQKEIPKTYYIEKLLKINWDIILEEAIPNNWDCLGIVFGKEGSGKTTFAVQTCKYLDKTFCAERVVFTPEQFIKACDSALPEEAILWDEAITGASIDKQMGNMGKAIVTKLTMIRRKKLKILILLPYLLMMQKYFVNRCLFSVYVYAKGFSKRGYLKFYNQTQTEYLYNLMKDKYRNSYLGAMSHSTYSFDARFHSKFPIDFVEYEKRKEEATFDPFDTKSDGEKKIHKCKHTSWRYVRTKNEWYCVTCGKRVNINPYENDINDIKNNIMQEKNSSASKEGLQNGNSVKSKGSHNDKLEVVEVET